ncbi:MAG TPA: porin [Spongiibacteraceae bacterium]|nr:porin [Spongiibacteraceae bacterium]
MKHHALPLLVAALSTGLASAALADDLPTVYGKVNLSLQAVDTEVDRPAPLANQVIDDNWQMRSNASRLGVKGSYGISDSLKAVYKLEYEISADEGDFSGGDELKARNMYAGLQGSFGTVIAGRHDSPLKLVQGDVDRFNDLLLGDIREVLVGEERIKNIVMYSTPSMAGFGFHLAIAPGEESGNNARDDGLADSVSAAVTYQQDIFYVALAVDENVAGNDVIRAVGEITLDALKLGAIYQTADINRRGQSLGLSGELRGFYSSYLAIAGIDLTDQDGYLLSAEWTSGDIVLKAQWMQATTDWEISGVASDQMDSTQLALGADYRLNKQATLFAYWASVEHDTNAGTVFDGSTIGAGFELKF